MQQIEEPSPGLTTAPLWQLAFRPGFLAAALCAVWAMIAWLLILEGKLGWDHDYPPTRWHAHEMLFGFAPPVVVGFLLTAVATWTGVAGRVWAYPCCGLCT
ncbi:MAG: NnrS family protein [Gammaproteobacteria bacterium]|nr:NnrS family protein [Gammaproteobacteria bacterium]